jgi:TolB-like protein
MSNFFGELKRRNVVRVGLAYTVIGWLLAQVAEFAFDNFGAPDWALKTFVIVLVLGLLPTLLFAWVFELTPDGIRREKDIVRETSVTTQTGRKLDIVIIVLVVVAIAVVLVDRLIPEDGVTATPQVAVDGQSIAVLPFVDLSADQSQAYFGQGLAEELLNTLAQFPKLRVAARTSAFSFAGRNVDLREVGATLNVANVLEGSIRRSDDRLRVTAQLIRASDGFHLWSETYERDITDIFAIQDDIVNHLAIALQVRLGVGAGANRSSSHEVEPQAYDSYLRGLQLWASRDEADNRTEAMRALRLAKDLDPGFADAWAAYAISLMLTTAGLSGSGVSIADWLPTAETALLTALELDPDLARTHAGLGFLYGIYTIDIAKSKWHLQHARELAPNSADAHFLSAMAATWRGSYEDASVAMSKARELDPLNRTIERVEFEQWLDQGQLDLARRGIELCPQDDCLYDHIVLEIYLGNWDGALAELDDIVTEAGGPGSFPDEATDLIYAFATAPEMRAIFSGDIEAIKADRELYVEPPASGYLPFVLSRLTHAGEFDLAMDLLEYAAENGEFPGMTNAFNLIPGAHVFPDDFRRFERYRAFWQRPGLSELAAERIANGRPDGLPIHEDEDVTN